MAMTIKEKVMKAWLRDLEVEVCWDEGDMRTGHIISFMGSQMTIRHHETYVNHIEYTDITSIRFVDEEEETEGDGELKGKCNYQDQKRPRRHCHEINGYWCDDPRCIDYVSKGVAQQIKIDKLISEKADLELSLSEVVNALKIVGKSSTFARTDPGTTRVSDRIYIEFNPDQWRMITDALEKAGE